MRVSFPPLPSNPLPKGNHKCLFLLKPCSPVRSVTSQVLVCTAEERLSFLPLSSVTFALGQDVLMFIPHPSLQPIACTQPGLVLLQLPSPWVTGPGPGQGAVSCAPQGLHTQGHRVPSPQATGPGAGLLDGDPGYMWLCLLSTGDINLCTPQDLAASHWTSSHHVLFRDFTSSHVCQ